jgi:biopolymer transport protein ExbB
MAKATSPRTDIVHHLRGGSPDLPRHTACERGGSGDPPRKVFSQPRWRYAWLVLALVIMASPCVLAAAAELGGAAPPGDNPPQTKSLVDFIKAGKTIGHVIIFLSFVGMAMVIDCFMRISTRKLVPTLLASQVVSLAREARMAEIVHVCRASDSLLGRILAKVMSQRPLSLASARDALQEEGVKEITRLQHRVGYVGFIATVAPMLGLLGTVTGMIYSFNVLGTSQEYPKPDQLAIGVAEALVTTCEGLIVAIPLMFFHLHFRGRVTRIGQDAAEVCDSVMRGLAAVIEARTTGRPPQYDLEAAAKDGPSEQVVEEYEINGGGAEGLSPDDFPEEDGQPKA